MSEIQIPGATVKTVSTHTVMAKKLSNAEEKKREAIDQSWKEAQQKREDEFRGRAAGRKMVREMNTCGPCIKLGIVMRETANFFVYAVDAHRMDGDIESFKKKRVRKNNVHVEACVRCKDHPKTHYPMGSAN